jgi:hypothetical protein
MKKEDLQIVADKAAEIYREQPAKKKNILAAVTQAIRSREHTTEEYREICKMLGHRGGVKKGRKGIGEKQYDLLIEGKISERNSCVPQAIPQEVRQAYKKVEDHLQGEAQSILVWWNKKAEVLGNKSPKELYEGGNKDLVMELLTNPANWSL